MAYDQRYYDERKKDLEGDFNKAKDKAFLQMMGVANQWNVDAQELQKKFKELSDREAQEQEKKDEKDPRAERKIK